MLIGLWLLAVVTIAIKEGIAGLTTSINPHTKPFFVLISSSNHIFRASFSMTIILPLLLMEQPLVIAAVRLKRLIQKPGMYGMFSRMNSSVFPL